ncbi:MAG: type II toxin-antitoxin system RelE/ParE family toxin [Planctomycetota bacterium]
MNVLVLDEAAIDIETAIRFYDLQHQGIGDYFKDSILADLDALSLFAGIHPMRFGYHRALAKRFPYAIYYLLEGDTACVYAVLDMRRDPKRLERELSDRSPD